MSLYSQTPPSLSSKFSPSLSVMENRLKLRISRMFRASFGSCRSRNISDVMEKAVFAHQKHRNFQMIEPLPPKARPFPSICKPRCPEKTHMIMVDNSCINTAPRRKVSEQYSPFVVSNGRTCPPASPISPWNPDYKCKEFGFKEKKKAPVKNKNKKTTRLKKSKRRDNMCKLSSSSQDSFNYGGWWFSSNDEKEDETETLFSSKSLSSNSSESLRLSSRRRKHRTRRRRAAATKSADQMGVLPLSEGKVKDSFAVVKSSRDPYNDFRTSMVEMIIEKQIFSAQDLEQLLQCFLSLNSYHHHRVIVEVFTEIWEALFSNWS